jgi:hypothetical protein
MKAEAVVAVTGVASMLGLLIAIATWRRRRSNDRRDGVFRCRIRPAGPRDGARLGARRAARARWAHDVLIVRTGILSRTLRVLPVRHAHRILELRVNPPRSSTVSIHLEADDGSSYEITTTPDRVDLLAGPFVTAHPAIGERGTDRMR